jgi:steroid 5-alpha reductase family enzyme
LAVVGLTWVSDYFPRQIVLSSLVIVWALRLGIYLVSRVIKRGSDERFNEMRKVWWKWALFWSTQITWVWVVFLPVMFIQATHTDKPLNACDYVGWTVWVWPFFLPFSVS